MCQGKLHRIDREKENKHTLTLTYGLSKSICEGDTAWIPIRNKWGAVDSPHQPPPDTFKSQCCGRVEPKCVFD